MPAMDWKETARKKRESVLELIPQEWRMAEIPSASEQRDVTGTYIQQYLSPEEIEITETDAAGILKKTCAGEWSAYNVTKAFCHRAAVAHQLVNCLHEIFFDAALESAKQLDEYFAKHQAASGPLHGLPVSLKDQFHVKGVETHMGYVGWIGTFQGQKGTGKEKVYESVMVEELRQLGAVLYVKTSVPHTLMAGETVNNIIEYCWNPTNRELSCGGSSGGEGALIALKGSPIGFGTDIGGSIRIPAAFNGLYGLRPSSGRLPYEGMANSFDGAPTVLSVVGPLAGTPSGLKLMTQAILSQQPWLHDPLVIPMPWRAEQEAALRSLAQEKKLVFGVMRCDGVAQVHPPVNRAIDELVKKLEGEGHEIIDWKPPSHERLMDICNKAWGYDRGADARRAFALSGEPMAAQILDPGESEQANATEIMENQVDKRNAQREHMEYWNSTAQKTEKGREADAIICPCAPFAAARPLKYTYYGYSNWVNVLDYTSVVVPITKVDKKIDKPYTNFESLNETDKITQETYDAEIYDGAQVGLQLVGRRLQEEKMLALAEYVGGLLHG